jgi:hypothetical protein
MKFRLKLGKVGKRIVRRVALAPDGVSGVFKCRHAKGGRWDESKAWVYARYYARMIIVVPG